MTMDIRDTVIIGSGCSGLTAAIYCARAKLSPLVLHGHEPGGQLSITSLVENFPGWPEGVQGPDLISNMVNQAEKFGAEFATGEVTKADLTARPFTLSLDGKEIRTRTLIIASGASARWLGLPSEQALIGHGVSSCATCDGFFFNGKEVAVIGGGDSAMEEALFLTRFASKVTVLHRSERFRASKFMLERARINPKIHFISNVTVDEIQDVEKQEVTGIKLRHVHSGHTHVLPVSGFFLGIGHIPNTKPFVGQLDMDEEGYLKTRDHVFTGVPGVFACGDVQDRRYRQAITAAGTGCMAAIEVERFLEEQGR